MIRKKVKLCAIWLLVLGITGIQAQEIHKAVQAAGGNASGNGGTASYSVGQLFYTTKTGINGSVAQGVQQPFNISAITGIEEAKGITLLYSAYPNPITDFLTIKIDASTVQSIQSLTYQLFDISEKLLETNTLEGNETRINMRNLSPATYFLKVIQGNKVVKVFKIIKN